MNKSEVNKYKMRSDLGKLNKGPWATDYDQMAKKTCIRRLEPYLPKSTELAVAFAADERTVTQVDGHQEIEDDFIDVEAIDDETGEIVDVSPAEVAEQAVAEVFDGFAGEPFA
jgi:recombination protein RecT